MMGYYAGDFYRGDPGFMSFISGVGKSIIGAAKGALGIGAGRVPMPGGAVLAPVMKAGTKIISAGKILAKHPVMTAAGAAGAIGAAGTMMGRRGGGSGAGGSFGRKGRRMRVTNVRALRRAIRRASGFARLARRVLHFTSPHPPKGRVYFKAKKHRRGV